MALSRPLTFAATEPFAAEIALDELVLPGSGAWGWWQCHRPDVVAAPPVAVVAMAAVVAVSPAAVVVMSSA